MDKDRRRVCACGCIKGMDRTAAWPPPWCREEEMGEKQEGNEKRVFIFLARVSPIKSK